MLLHIQLHYHLCMINLIIYYLLKIKVVFIFRAKVKV